MAKASRCSPMLGALITLMILGHISSSAASTQQRVRKELRSLNESEYASFIKALKVIVSVPSEDGQKLYGPNYQDHDYFVVKHAVASSDARGDQGHNGAPFMTYHRALLLEFEAAVLSVSPDLRALPYLDILLDLEGGKYYGTPKAFFSEKYAGGYDCASGPANQCQVLDGKFPNFTIPTFNTTRWASITGTYNGSTATGLRRGTNNDNVNSMLSRFPTKGTILINAICGSFTKGCINWWFNATKGLPAGLKLKYSKQDYYRCVNAASYTSWMEWNFCSDFSSMISDPNQEYSPYFDRYLDNMSPVLHPSLHQIAGGLNADGTQGDMTDTTTSPNEILAFFIHHANIDRNAMIWQANSVKLNSSMADPAVMWMYPKEAGEFFNRTGCFLHDVISSVFPFPYTIFGGSLENPPNVTHFDVLYQTRPGYSAYTYDNMKSY